MDLPAQSAKLFYRNFYLDTKKNNSFLKDVSNHGVYDASFRLEMISAVGKSSFLVLQHSNSSCFNVINESMKAFLVELGPQVCGCQYSHCCVHVMYVMLKTLKLDPYKDSTWSSRLNSHQVNMLLRNHRTYKLKLAEESRKKRTSKSLVEQFKAEIVESYPCILCSRIVPRCDSNVKCHSCLYYFHSKCFSVWYEQFSVQNNQVLCPVCEEQVDSQDTLEESIKTLTVEQLAELTNGNTLQMMSENMSSLKLSPSHIVKSLQKTLLETLYFPRVQQSSSFDHTKGSDASTTCKNEFSVARNKLVTVACQILAASFIDDDFEVFKIATVTFKHLMLCVFCKSKDDVEDFQHLLYPVIESLILRCADSKKQVREITFKTLGDFCDSSICTELYDLGFKKDLSNISQQAGSVEYVVSFLDMKREMCSENHQWLISRLELINNLLTEFRHEFIISSDDEISENTAFSPGLQQIFTIVQFALTCKANLSGYYNEMAQLVLNKIDSIADECAEEDEVLVEQFIIEKSNELKSGNRLQHQYRFLNPFYELVDLPLKDSIPSTSRHNIPPIFRHKKPKVLSRDRPEVPPRDESQQPPEVPPREPIVPPRFKPAIPPRLVQINNQNSPLFTNKVSRANYEEIADYSTLHPSERARQLREIREAWTPLCPNISPESSPTTVSASLWLTRSTDPQSCDLVFSGPIKKSQDRSSNRDVYTRSISCEYPNSSPKPSGHGVSLESRSIEDLQMKKMRKNYLDCDVKTDSDLKRRGIALFSSSSILPTNLKDSKYQHLMFASSDRDLSVDPIQSLRLSSDSQSVEGSEDSESDDTEGFDADLETLNDSKVAKYKSKHARSDREAKIEKMWRRKARKLSMSKHEHIAFRSSTESLVDVQSPISRRRCKKSTVVPQLSWQHDEVDIIRVQTPLNKGYVEGIDWFKGPKIGFGGSCSCFQARDVKTGKLMAVKQIHIPPPIGRMVRDTCSSSVVSEIHFLRTLDHPNVVKLVGATKGPLFYNIFMEWCPNGTVSRLLQQYGRFEDSVISVYIKQLLEGLRYIHSRRIIHRDIKGKVAYIKAFKRRQLFSIAP